MGMYDHIDVEPSLASEWCIDKCRCGYPLMHDECGNITPRAFQTKSLACAMDEYYLRRFNGVIRLVKLDEPEKKPPFFTPYTEAERSELQSKYNACEKRLKTFRVYALDLLRIGSQIDVGGTFAPQANWPENRRQYQMGELPHQWVEFCAICDLCQTLTVVKVQFTNGVVESHSVEHED